MKIDSLYARISPWFRRRRLRLFRARCGVTARTSILDVGGTSWMWEEFRDTRNITLANLHFPAEEPGEGGDLRLVEADGRALPFADRSFDVALSNSVIEHLGDWENQQRFAAEVRRVGRAVWVQTPAREFFIEPHLMAPFVHWLPRAAQVRMVRNCTVRGWLTRPAKAEVDRLLNEIRLLTRDEMAALFPDCVIVVERFLGMPKSYIAIRRHSHRDGRNEESDLT